MSSQVITHVTVDAKTQGGQTQEIPIVPDGREKSVVFARPARQDEVPGVRLGPDETLVFRVELSHVWLTGNPNPVRVLPDGREGSTVFVRQLRPSEQDTGDLVKFIPNEEQLVMTTHVTHAALHLTDQVGRTDDLLTAVRVVPVGREGSIVLMRTLQPGEPDNGETVRLRPGDIPQFSAGDFVLNLDYIDERESVPSDDGYAPITNILWTWLVINGSAAPDGARFLLATSRRLDAAHRLLRSVRASLDDLQREDLSAVGRRDLIYSSIGDVELAVVALHRALRMTSQLKEHFGLVRVVPEAITKKLSAIVQLRNAYEHIDERARGLRGSKPDLDSLSVFDSTRLFSEHSVSYGTHTLELDGEATRLLLDAREYLKSAASELAMRKAVGNESEL